VKSASTPVPLSTLPSAPATASRPAASLTGVPTSRLPTCGACGSIRVTEITMTLGDGSAVDFTSCHHCEDRSWTQDGRPLERAAVLGRAGKPKA
jgi:hypothetical protein